MKIKKGTPIYDQHDKNGFYGGKFGGNFVAEGTLRPIQDLTKLFEKLRKDKKFLAKKDQLFKNYLGGETPLFKLEKLSEHLGGAQIWCKDVSSLKGSAHKGYHAIVNALICKMSGRKHLCGDTGAGMFGKNLAMAGKHLGLKVKIFMGTKDISRQAVNVKFMRDAGAEIVPVDSGSKTLVDAVSECMRYWVANCDTTAMCVGSTVGPAIFVRICGWSTSQISRELKVQLINEFGEVPKKIKLYNCVGGGSSSFGFWNEFMDYDKKQVEFIGVEAGGPSKSKKHAAPLTYGSKIGILHGAAQYVNQNSDGQIEETESISAGLDYPGISPLHCFLKDTKRARYTAASDEEALKAYQIVTKYENLRPSLEPSHAFSVAIKEAKKLSKNTIVVINSCGDAYKDRGILEKKLGKKYVKSN